MLRVLDLGRDVPYPDGLHAMRTAMERVDVDGPTLLLLEQRPTITITRRGGVGAFVSPRAVIEADGIDVIEADRGGDVTFHGPGQLTGYPVLRLGDVSLGVDVVGFVRAIEAAIVDVCRGFGVDSARGSDGKKDAAGTTLTGVWADAAVVDASFQVERQPAKVCAIGVGLGGGVSRHGFALNVTTELERYTRHVVPCGLRDHGVTSLERLLPRAPAMDAVKAAVTRACNAHLLRFHRPRA